MLYDILPPLLLLASFGGIISMFSRVVVRVQRDRLSAEIKAHSMSDRTVTAEEVLKGRGPRIKLLSSRLLGVRQGATAFTSRLRGGFASAGSRLKSGIKDRQAARTLKRAAKIEKKAVVLEEPRPTLHRVVEEPASPQPTEDQASTVSRLLGRKKATATPQATDPLGQASVCLKERKFKKAEDILLPYIVQHTRDVKAYMLLGRSAIGRGQWGEALEVYRQVKSIDATVPGLNAALGTAALKAGKMTLAVECLQKARDEEPTNVSIRQQLLNIAQRMDNKVLERSVLEELSQLKQPEATAQAEK
ncbi:MAG: hypothetical protein HYR90_01300 [Candidatus Andersenbacteria bacterium]|nr:hypothetical protein [Candidatus Andersenbacteria bacterium]MBI3250502.1 hypothetical protein [Candidatus Andersenbacteria bacterium]